MFWKKKPFPEIMFLWIITAIVYLPQIGRLIYYTDDWYYIYDSMVGGAKIFHEMFRIDRPVRGFFFELYYSVLGNNPLSYHLSMYIWRGISAMGALWLFSILWPARRKFNFGAALLFAIYPGYFWWISAIEYQPMMVSLALMVISIALTLKAIQSTKQVSKIMFAIGAILTGWIYIALVDYAIGMEIFRFLCVYLLANRKATGNLWNRLVKSSKLWSWNFVIPAGFSIWHTFFFVNQRQATDVGSQLSVLFNKPAATLVNWIFQLYNSLLNLSVLAWIDQFPSYLQGLRLRDLSTGLALAVLVVVLVFLAQGLIKASDESNDGEQDPAQVGNEPLLLGGLGMIFGALPVVMANRYINIGGYSHYALPVSLAAAVFLAALIESLSLQSVRMTIFYVVAAFAALSHYGIANKAATDEAALQSFWWQAAWRAPAIRAGTTMVIQYPIAGMADDGYGLMEAANVIYFPEPNDQVPVKYPLAGITPNDQNIPDILAGTNFIQDTYRSHTVDFDFSNLLVITQPTLGSCVHIIDGSQPLISSYDPVNVSLAAPSSKIGNVVTDVQPAIPPAYIYGSEPKHDWCYYFEKADLAAQMDDWKSAASLGDEAIRLDLSPNDTSEWLPFLKAYAITGNAGKLSVLAKRVIGDKALRSEACNWLSKTESPLSAEVTQAVGEYYCK